MIAVLSITYLGRLSKDSEKKSTKFARISLSKGGVLVCFYYIIKTKLAFLKDINSKFKLIFESRAEYNFLELSLMGAKHDDGRSMKSSSGASMFFGDI